MNIILDVSSHSLSPRDYLRLGEDDTSSGGRVPVPLLSDLPTSSGRPTYRILMAPDEATATRGITGDEAVTFASQTREDEAKDLDALYPNWLAWLAVVGAGLCLLAIIGMVYAAIGQLTALGLASSLSLAFGLGALYVVLSKAEKLRRRR